MTQLQVNLILDWLLKGRVFKAAPLNLHIKGSPSRETRRETFFADMLLSGIQPNPYSYFLFRIPSEPTINGFDVVFFNDDGSGYAVGIPSKLVSEISDYRITFSFVLKGGGEAGHVVTTRTFSFSRSNDSEDCRMLQASFEEDSIAYSIWRGRRKETSHAEIQFEAADLAEALTSLAQEMPLGKRPVVKAKGGADKRRAEGVDERKGSNLTF